MHASNGFLYAVVFDNGVVKVGAGYTVASTKERIRVHGVAGRAFGHEIVDTYQEEVTSGDLLFREQALISMCNQIASRYPGTERSEWMKFESASNAGAFLKAALPKTCTEEGKNQGMVASRSPEIAKALAIIQSTGRKAACVARELQMNALLIYQNRNYKEMKRAARAALKKRSN